VQETHGPRCGTIVLAGRPNAGKSTLLNALVQQPLAITSPKPQSTRLPVFGIRTDPDVQLIFIDPPGLLPPSYALQRSMVVAAADVLSTADAVLLVHPVTDGPPPSLEDLLKESGQTLRWNRPWATVLSQADRAREVPPESDRIFVVSATQEQGFERLLEWCRGVVPERPFCYAADDVSTQPVRFFAAEYIREAAFAYLEDEVPYSLAAEIEEFRETDEPVYIRAVVYVERPSQRGIVIGAGGQTLRTIGAKARGRIEQLLGQRVYLDLWVKVMPNWRSRPKALQRFGFPISSKEPT
jgi:GTP-binding protein Era